MKLYSPHSVVISVNLLWKHPEVHLLRNFKSNQLDNKELSILEVWGVGEKPEQMAGYGPWG